MFHVSLLKDYHQREGETPERPEAELINGEEECEVEIILRDRRFRGENQFLVKWKGYPDYENSWKTVENAPEAIREYRAVLKPKPDRHRSKRER